MAAAKRPSAEGRVTIARHGALPSRHPVVSIIAMFAVVLGIAGVSLTGITAFNLWDATRAIADNSVVLDDEKPLPPSLGAIEGGVNLLLVGTDSCEGQDVSIFPRCANDDSPGERNDVTMLVHISDAPRRVTVVSFPRDMLVPIPSCKKSDGSGNISAMSSQMINASYWYGGLGCTVDTVEALIGDDFNIDFAAAIRWTGVINMSDAVGGVDVCVAGDINDGHTGLHLTAGTHTLKGVEALQFLRIRHGIGDGSDLGRISNQQQFMGSMVRKLQSDSVLANPATLLNLATTAISQVQQGQLVLSSGLTNPTLMVQIAMAVKDVPYEDIVFVQYPTVYSSDGLRVQPVKADAKALFDAIKANQPLTLTGDASGGYAVEVTGEATQPVAPAPGATDTGATPAAGTDTPVAPPAEERVALPSDITGQTAADTTCTLPQK